MIWVARTAASIGRASSACSRRSAKAASGLCSRSRRPGWRATAATGMLIEFCGLVGTIIVDEDGIYDPRHPNDRLLLGMKGTMSELELSLFRQRSHEALKQKARRGALFLRLAAGYVKAGRDRIEKDPDQRVQDALKLVFSKFAEFQSARQVHVWLRDEGIVLPVKSHNTKGARHHLEIAGIQHRTQHSDQPDLCRRLCL